MSSKDRADNRELEKRIEELEKQLELARMKNVALNTMIDIAEQDYKLSIRKKSGPKQLAYWHKCIHYYQKGLFVDCLGIADRHGTIAISANQNYKCKKCLFCD